MKVAVLLADGFEEIEALTVVDVLRRARVECEMVAVKDVDNAEKVMVGDGKEVMGAHGIQVRADSVMTEVEQLSFDMIVLPGGLPGADNLRDNVKVTGWVQNFVQMDGKNVAAICAAPQVLAKANVVRGRRATSYPADMYRQVLAEAGADYKDERVVVDGRMITSQGPGTSLEFAYTLLEVLGVDASGLKAGMLYRS